MAISLPLPSPSPSPSEERLTLPPLRTLDLPTMSAETSCSSTRLPGIQHFHSLHDNERSSRTIPLHAPHATVPIPRHFSFSSSTSSRTPSPSPSDLSSVSNTISTATNSMFPCIPTPSTSFSCDTHTSYPFPPSASSSRSKMRLIPSSLEDADAVVVVPPPSRSEVYGVDGQKQQPLLLVGPALKHLRHPQRQITKGARIHPYRIARVSNSHHHQRSVREKEI